MRRVLTFALAISFATALIGVGPAIGANPPGTGLPGQSCQALEPNTPGMSSSSPGSAFNEPGINSTSGGTGGLHYSATSQYDVACFQLAQK